jgi:hypothetical protein
MVIGDVARNSQWETLCCAGRGSRFTAGRGSGSGRGGKSAPGSQCREARVRDRPIDRLQMVNPSGTPRVRNTQ